MEEMKPKPTPKERVLAKHPNAYWHPVSIGGGAIYREIEGGNELLAYGSYPRQAWANAAANLPKKKGTK